MSQILIILAHPQLQYSRLNTALLKTARKVKSVKIHDLYELYPDFLISTKVEQSAMEKAHTIILQHPFQWYSCPALMKEWLDTVLQKGWAYGDGGTALRGKTFMNVITTGGASESYSPEGHNRFSMQALLTPFEQTAHLCGMHYKPPFCVHNAMQVSDAELKSHAQDYETLLTQLKAAHSHG